MFTCYKLFIPHASFTTEKISKYYKDISLRLIYFKYKAKNKNIKYINTDKEESKIAIDIIIQVQQQQTNMNIYQLMIANQKSTSN